MRRFVTEMLLEFCHLIIRTDDWAAGKQSSSLAPNRRFRESIVGPCGPIIAPRGPIVGSGGPIIAPRGPIVGPGSPIVGSANQSSGRAANVGPCGPIVGPCGPIVAPRGLIVAPCVFLGFRNPRKLCILRVLIIVWNADEADASNADEHRLIIARKTKIRVHPRLKIRVIRVL